MHLALHLALHWAWHWALVLLLLLRCRHAHVSCVREMSLGSWAHPLLHWALGHALSLGCNGEIGRAHV